MTKPLDGVRALEMGQLIAGPFAGKMLAEFGAHVTRIEPPGTGDPLRKWRLLHDDTSVWWAAQSRSEESLTLDLRLPEGQDIARKLISESDVLIENFRPGTLEAWGLSWEDLHTLNPRLVMLRVSGCGHTGPYRDRAGFGVVAEAMGGLRHLSGESGRTPVRVGVSIGDSLSALHGVIGILLALRHRDQNGGEGQMIDVALYESVFNMMESLLPLGGCPYAPGPTGNVCTEELVHMLELDGYQTGVNLAAVLTASSLLPQLIGREVPSQLLKAGRRLDLHSMPCLAKDGLPEQQAFSTGA